MKIKFLLILLVLTGCCVPRTPAYKEYYAHLCEPVPQTCVTQSPYFIIFLVNAPHLDYTNNQSFLRTMAKHPSNCSKEGDVGHAWVYLHGDSHVIEGGHSGERGICQPRYFEGIIQKMEEGCDNPISYLWEPQNDGFFQRGNGGHCPTFAAKVNITEEEYKKIVRFLQCYQFRDYALTGNQCASFVAQIGSLIDFPIECEQTVSIASCVCDMHLWNDPVYSLITVSTPDVVEKSLIGAVRSGRAENVTRWYINRNRYTFRRACLWRLPTQTSRWFYLN